MFRKQAGLVVDGCTYDTFVPAVPNRDYACVLAVLTGNGLDIVNLHVRQCRTLLTQFVDQFFDCLVTSVTQKIH